MHGLHYYKKTLKPLLDGPLLNLCLVFPPSDQDGCTAVLNLTQDSMGNSHKNHLVWNQQLNQNQTLMEQSLDGPLPKLCPAVALSHQDGHHSAVALLLKAALIQVSDYRLLGASGFISVVVHCSIKFVKLGQTTGLSSELIWANTCHCSCEYCLEIQK